MNQHIISGFIKRAQEYGVSKEQANAMLAKLAWSINGVEGGDYNKLRANAGGAPVGGDYLEKFQQSGMKPIDFAKAQPRPSTPGTSPRAQHLIGLTAGIQRQPRHLDAQPLTDFQTRQTGIASNPAATPVLPVTQSQTQELAQKGYTAPIQPISHAQGLNAGNNYQSNAEMAKSISDEEAAKRQEMQLVQSLMKERGTTPEYYANRDDAKQDALNSLDPEQSPQIVHQPRTSPSPENWNSMIQSGLAPANSFAEIMDRQQGKQASTMNEHIISGFIKRAQEHGLSTGQAIDLWEKVAAPYPNMGLSPGQRNTPKLGEPVISPSEIRPSRAVSQDVVDQKAQFQNGIPAQTVLNGFTKPIVPSLKTLGSTMGRSLMDHSIPGQMGEVWGRATASIPNPLRGVTPSTPQPIQPSSHSRTIGSGLQTAMDGFKAQFVASRQAALAGTQLPPHPADGIPTQPDEMGLLDETGAVTKPPIQ